MGAGAEGLTPVHVKGAAGQPGVRAKFFALAVRVVHRSGKFHVDDRSLQFRVQETDQVIRFSTAHDDLPELDRLPLVLITSNDERRLPAAFVRRCVQLTIGAPKRDRLFQIAKATEGDSNEVDEVCCRVYEALERMPQKESSTSVAEFLDAVRACLRLGADSKTLIHIMEATMEKSVKIREGSP